MGRAGEIQELVETRLWEPRATIAFTALLFLVYAAQLSIAGSVHWSAAHTVVTNLQQSWTPGLLVLSPLLHSNHGHVIGNAVFLLLGGLLAERRLGSKVTLLLMYVIGLAANVLPVTIVSSGGVGASGAVAGIWAFAGLTHSIELKRVIDETGSIPVQAMEHFFAIFGAIFFAVLPFPRAIGILPPEEGTIGHLTGVIVAVAFYCVIAVEQRELWTELAEPT